MRPHADPTAWQANGLCIEKAPDLDERGYAVVRDGDVPPAAGAAVAVRPNRAQRLEGM
jgi:hypothetical protein